MLQRMLFALIGLSFMILSGCVSSIQAPPSDQAAAERIYRKLPHYSRLVNTPWPKISLAAMPLRPGMQDRHVPQIRKRLMLLDDIPFSYHGDQHFDAHMAAGVKKFQWRHGLKADGVIGESTLRALNVPPQQRLRQLVVNMQRWQQFPKSVGDRFVRINVPSFELEVVEGGEKVMNMRVIVGKKSRPTPELYSKVQTIVLNPKWNIPHTILKHDVIPGMIANPNFLAEHNIKVYSSWKKDAYEVDPTTIDWRSMSASNFPYKLQVPVGPKNPLGRIKFVFMNDKDIYMHDTPQKGLFNQIHRAYSSGCLRVEEPYRLVEYFLKDNTEWDHEMVTEHVASGDIKYIRIKEPVPIFITYITAWVDKAGEIHFREDIYKRDIDKAPGSSDESPSLQG